MASSHLSSSTTKLIQLRRVLLQRALKPFQSSNSNSSIQRSSLSSSLLFASSKHLLEPSTSLFKPLLSNSHLSRSFSSHSHDEGPAAIDYRSILQEDEYQRLAESTIHDLLEKLEEYGDSVDVDGFDIDYGNEVLTLKLGSLGTYVINKQTPNRQIWMSSPVSGPSRYDWDRNAQAWIYRRTKADLRKVLENELEQLCGEPVSLC